MASLAAQFGLAGRRAVVGGATQGIGRACALALAEAGADVTIMGRNDEALALVVAQMQAARSGNHSSVCVDFADWKRVQAAAAQIAATGPVHALIHNTGGPAAGFAVDSAPEEFARAMELHLLTGQALVQALAPGMREARYGRIVYIGSTSVVTPIRGLGVSNSVRAAMANWIRSLAAELGRFGITANTILPGYTKTARLDSLFRGRATRAGSTVEQVEADAVAGIPAGRLGKPEEIAAAAVFLCSPAGAYVNGVNLAVDGGRLAVQT